MTGIHELMHWNRPSSISVRRGENLGSSLTSLQEEMNRLFDRFFTTPQIYAGGWEEKALSVPSINVVEDGESFKIEAELAGMDPKKVDVEFANGFLTLKGERGAEEREEGENYLRHEISYGSFQRAVALPETADCDKAKALFKNGILTVTVPKKAEAVQKPKKIEVRAAA